MTPVARIAREIRFLSGLARTLWRVRKIDPDSDVLICDDFEDAVDKFADHTALVFEGQRYTYRQLDALANRFAAWADAQGVKARRHGRAAVAEPRRIRRRPGWAWRNSASRRR